jgi:hypothetical protein
LQGAYSDWAVTLPSGWLVWLATSSARMAVYRLQGWHGPLRLLHVAGTATFFGAIVLLDLRLLGVLGRNLALDALTRLVLPITHWSFGVLLISGVLLFIYDPIQQGSHSWFLPKMVVLGLAVANAALFSLPRLAGLCSIGAGSLTRHARVAGALSLVLWAGVISSATANHEERPMVRGRSVVRPVPAARAE